MRRVAVIMAGGSGERFWPLSTPQRPKQLLKLTSSGKTMLEDAIDRIEPLVGLDNIFISTVPTLLQPIHNEIGFPIERILAEPAKRNTAGALVWVAAQLLLRYPGEELSLAILTADQLIEPIEEFRATIANSMDFAEGQTSLVTIGIPPTRPETGFGYIQLGKEIGDRLYKVERFTEKPDLETAVTFLGQGSYMWNSGMFFWTMDSFVEELRNASLVHSEALAEVLEGLQSEDEKRALSAFERLPNLSIDYVLMEQSQNVYCARASFTWDDVGSWDSLRRTLSCDENGNVTTGTVRLLDSSEAVVYNDRSDIEVYALGLANIVVVVSGNRVMICPESKAQEVKRLAQLNLDSGSTSTQ